MKIVRITDGSFRRRGKKWDVTCWIEDEHGRQFRRYRGGFAKKALAVAWLEQQQNLVRKGEAEIGRSRFETLQELVDAYYQDGCSGKGPSTLARDKQSISHFIEHAGATTLPEAIDSRVIDSFVSARKEVAKPRTVNRDLGAVRHLFNVAVRWGALRVNPTAGLARQRVPDGEVVYLEPDEQERLLKACTLQDRLHNSRSEAPFLRPLVAVAMYTGFRKGELFNLRWRDVDLDGRVITAQNTATFKTKSKKNRTVGLHPAAVAELKAWREWFKVEIGRAAERAGSGRLSKQLREKAALRLDILRRCEPSPERLVFPSFRAFTDDGEPLPMENIDGSFKNAIKAAKVKCSGLHVLRHTFAVAMARAGVPLPELSKHLGHANLATTMIYLRFSPNEGLRSTDKLPTIGAETATVEIVGKQMA